MPPDSRVNVGVCAIVTAPLSWDHGDFNAKDAIRVLMMHRMGEGPYAGDGFNTWAFPGGWLEFGEMPFAAAEREVLEETGLVVEAVDDYGYIVNESESGEFHIVTLCVECRFVSGEPKVMEPDKCDAVEWVPIREARQRKLMVATRTWFDTQRPEG